jgi:hypothetical protein
MEDESSRSRSMYDHCSIIKARFIYEADQGIRYVDGSGVSAIANIRSLKVLLKAGKCP